MTCTGRALRRPPSVSGQLPGTATVTTVTPTGGSGAVTITRSGASASVPTQQQVPWVGAVAMFDGSQTMVGAWSARRGGTYM